MPYFKTSDDADGYNWPATNTKPPTPEHVATVYRAIAEMGKCAGEYLDVLVLQTLQSQDRDER